MDLSRKNNVSFCRIKQIGGRVVFLLLFVFPDDFEW